MRMYNIASIPIGRVFWRIMKNKYNPDIDLNILANFNGKLYKILLQPSKKNRINIEIFNNNRNILKLPYLYDIFYTENEEKQLSYDYIEEDIFNYYILTIDNNKTLRLHSIKETDEYYNIARFEMNYIDIYCFISRIMNICYHGISIRDMKVLSKITAETYIGKNKLFYNLSAEELYNRRKTYNIQYSHSLRIKIPKIKKYQHDSTPTPNIIKNRKTKKNIKK
jgi:hypothetical protein